MSVSIAKKAIKAVVIGCSAGGIEALNTLLPKLPHSYAAAVMVVQHIHASSNRLLADSFDEVSQVTVKMAEDFEDLVSGTVYMAPPNYHLLVENAHTLALSVDARVHYSRPSIDVLFQSAARVFQNQLAGVVLTGANHDGSEGLKMIQAYGGWTLVQDPQTAEYPKMPQAALDAVERVDCQASVEHIAQKLIELTQISQT